MDESYFKDPANRFLRERPLDPLQAPMGYSQAHIRDRVRQVDEMIRQVEAQIAGLDRNIASLQDVVKNHLWVLPETSTQAFENLAVGKAKAEGLRARLNAIREGFLSLPTEESLMPKIAHMRREAREADVARAAEAEKLHQAEEAEKKKQRSRTYY